MRACLLLLALFAIAAPARAQEDEGQDICLAVAHRWSGTLDDVRRIRDFPVPESFRRPFEAGGCARFQLVHADLVAWHLAYGDEATVGAALAWLAADRAFADAPAPAAFGAALARAWPAGERAARALLARDPQGRTRAAAPQVLRLQTLIAVQSHYLFMADQYLRAASFHHSLALLAEARRYVGPLRDSARLIHGEATPESDPDLDLRNRLGVRQHNALEIADLETRLAIQQARFSRSPADVDAAQALVDRGFSSVLRDAADHLDRIGDFCDNGSGDGLDEIRAACDAENNFLGRLAYFWRNQAMLDMLMAADPVHYQERPRGPPSATSAAAYVRRTADETGARPSDDVFGNFQTALALFDQDGRGASIPGPNFRAAAEEQIALHTAQAEMYERMAGLAADGDGDFLRAAMQGLLAVVRVAPPAEHPGRFRQAAARFLALLPAYEAARRREQEERYQPDAAFARWATYFRLVLPALDQVATGAAN